SQYASHSTLPSFPTRRSSDLATVPTPAFARRSRRSVSPTLLAFSRIRRCGRGQTRRRQSGHGQDVGGRRAAWSAIPITSPSRLRSEEHTSELQSRENLVCRLL